MNPYISNILDDEVLTFTMRNTNTSIVNAIRRTIINDIPSVIIKTELYEQNQCQIEINTTRFHNEIVKHRLSCIPVHMDFHELELLPDNYELEVDVKNETDHMIFVTTEDFKIRSKKTGNLLTEAETHKIFPPCEMTNSYIDFLRLRPKMTDTIQGEQIKLKAEFSIGTPRENSCFTVVSLCTYCNSPDIEAAREAWEQQEKQLKSAGMEQKEIDFHKKNYFILDAQRHYLSYSFDFSIQSVGVYQNKSIVNKACKIICEKLKIRIEELDTGLIQINTGNTTMNSYDIVLQNEDYTIGKIIEYMLYETYFQPNGGNGSASAAAASSTGNMNFCGFKKFHPHDTHSIIRVAYKEPVSMDVVRGQFREQATNAITIFENIGRYFEERG